MLTAGARRARASGVEEGRSGSSLLRPEVTQTHRAVTEGRRETPGRSRGPGWGLSRPRSAVLPGVCPLPSHPWQLRCSPHACQSAFPSPHPTASSLPWSSDPRVQPDILTWKSHSTFCSKPGRNMFNILHSKIKDQNYYFCCLASPGLQCWEEGLRNRGHFPFCFPNLFGLTHRLPVFISHRGIKQQCNHLALKMYAVRGAGM